MKTFKNKKISRLKRCVKYRNKIKNSKNIRLVVHRSSRHIYAQIIMHNPNKVLVSASTLEKYINNNLKYTGNISAAYIVGKIIAERSLKKNIKKISFDRSGFKYHGRVKALADSARKYGLNF
ncbi:50S ribosomal protein L18 [Buchnera aphidicola (Taiwanaphis decaspermi)]|uniref:50S ribosomal protein L18 n=1 Tax=Buchnera aphidicola TaxID=9 RepID=UPI0031B86D49